MVEKIKALIKNYLLLLFGISLCASVRGEDFKKGKIKINNTILNVEIADSDNTQKTGLMYRNALEDHFGMLFVYPNEQILSFWMKNTFIPLSIGFFNRDRELVDIQDMDPVQSIIEKNLKSYRSRAPSQFALEVNQGWFRKKKIKVGDKFQWVTTGSEKKAKPKP